MSAARSAVNPPMNATSIWASGALRNNGVQRATRYTPAVTIVAAWINALTGVGPSIASGSQTCSGNWADLAAAATKSSSAMAVRASLVIGDGEKSSGDGTRNRCDIPKKTLL